MKLLVTTDAHIFKTSDGAYWCGAIYGYNFWTRFMNVYDSIRVAARVKTVEKKEEKWIRVDGPNVEIFEIPFYQGPVQLMKRYFAIQKSIQKVSDGCDVVLYRLPSPTGQLIWKKIYRKKIPSGIEVVYDLTDDLKESRQSKVIKFITYMQIKFLRKACMRANGVSYVTEKTIQKKFPSYAREYGESENYFETYYSTITMNDSVYTGPRDFSERKNFTIAMSDVTMNSERKGERVFLQVIANLQKKGIDLRGIIIGDGKKKKEFERLARELNISEYVEFTGLLSSSEAVMKKLEQADIYVFPTAAEGLPRGVLEAMAVGLPVVTSPVGGIPEVIKDDQLVAPDDINRYTAIIEDMIGNAELMNRVSKENFEKAKEFENGRLQKRRDEFYLKLSNLAK